MDTQAIEDMRADKEFLNAYLARTRVDPRELEDLGHPYWDEFGQHIRQRDQARRNEAAIAAAFQEES
jgi:hypothetical protein